jgi:hypothetical protein
MAAVTYRCPVDPECPSESDRPSFCDVHIEPLERVVAAPPAEAPPGPGAPGTDTGTARGTDDAAAARRSPPIALIFEGEVLPVPAEGLELGRDCPDCARVPGLPGLLQVGRRHCRLYWEDGVLLVEDLMSLNGTYLDGRRVPARVPWPVTVGATLRLADDVEIPVREMDEFGFPKE